MKTTHPGNSYFGSKSRDLGTRITLADSSTGLFPEVPWDVDLVYCQNLMALP